MQQGSRVPGDGGCPMSPPWQRAAALHLQTCHCAVGNLSLGVPPKCPQGCRAKRAVTRWRDEAQPWWDAMGSASQGCRAGSRQSLPRVSRAEEVSQAPECMGRLQMAFAEPAASCSQPRRMRCGRRLATAPGVGKASKQPKRDPSAWPHPLSNAHAGVLSQAPAWPGKGKRGGMHLAPAGFFHASQPDLSAFCRRHLAKAVPP